MINKPVCYIPGREIPEVFSGTPTFLGLPKIKSKEDIKEHDIIFMGVPWEGICTWGSFTDCELGTKTIRNASVRYGGYLPDFDVDIFDHFSGGDYGDTIVQSGNYDVTYRGIEDKFSDIIENNKIPVVFGGDHSISYPLIRDFAKKHGGNIGIIHFDAHMDNMASFGDEKYARCSPFYRLYEEEAIDATKIVHVGIRGPRNNPSGLKSAKQYGATVITGMEIKLNGYMESIKKAIEIASDGTNAIYVTVCSDILDIANNPGGPPDPCGLTSFELAMMLYECGKAGAGAFDYVEVYPLDDKANVSSHTAVWMTLYFLQGVTKKRFNL
ncbi:agmatinase family protein [Wukongibacter baidiensis]|uniref:agmatinase family protein n=1 Tax=Wukongibacter baidiensis TaxID=1723361 RepID=UPI003D7F3C17